MTEQVVEVYIKFLTAFEKIKDPGSQNKSYYFQRSLGIFEKGTDKKLYESELVRVYGKCV